MRFPGRIAAAIEVLAEVETRRRPVAEALKSWGLANRFAGAGDRAAIGNLVYDALRRRASHAWAMDADDPRSLILSVVVREWGETPDGLAAAFSGDAHAPAPLSDEEVARLSAIEPLAGAPDHIRGDVPEWVAPFLAESLGPDWVAEAAAMGARPPLDLRVNTLKSTPQRVLKSLQRFHPEPAAVSPVGIRIPAGHGDSRTPNVQTDEAWLKGWFEVQDQGSQIAALLAGAEAGEQVLDLCAGAGGKSLAMAAAMQNKGQIFAHDSDRARLAPIYDRLKRAGVRNVQVVPPAPGALDALVDRMDRVVVDAPCTGSGTWRRRPDAKWKLSAEQVAARVGEQQTLLAEGARFVKPGGALVYITCSILPQENVEQADRFISSHPDFSLVAGHSLWHRHFAGNSARVLLPAAGGVVLTPHSTGTDGFYVMLATRRS
ncbi:MAG TPA: RsmB/NOP family class I SAM-dependent RNA methyltransferase [Devosiaceae bacterium]|jgi:16S rRNA (cytosine967-C5)-methyltransferase|nr:RsmB/NOP family class I SAM-dependent RNA methyltransferase [Devosiaceae bacterium]